MSKAFYLNKTISTLIKTVCATAICTQVHAFNSEEHSNIVDMGVERFFKENPEYVVLLEKLDIQVKTEAGEPYRRDTIAAKVFATGDDSTAAYTGWQESPGESPASLIYRKPPQFDEEKAPASAPLPDLIPDGEKGNNQNPLPDLVPESERGQNVEVLTSEAPVSGTRSRAQDFCFPPRAGYLQGRYNQKIAIPTELPNHIAKIPVYLSEKSSHFTLGQLSALYGDYRRTTYCESGKCYLTQEDIDKIHFYKDKSPCPKSVHVEDYFRYMASGVVPPMGQFANALANSAGLNNYDIAGWYGDELLRLANVNDWHFSNGAIAWYVGLHRLALYYVKRAKETGDTAYIIHALHHEANALHAFVDLFSFGHVVTNRGETAYGIIKYQSLLEKPAFKWSEFVFSLGGGIRDDSGKISLSIEGALKELSTGNKTFQHAVRKDRMKSYRGTGTLTARSFFEEKSHTTMNGKGAVVRNLNGDRFHIYGDGFLKKMGHGPFDVITMGVNASLTSLLKFYQEGTEGPMDGLAKLSQYYQALTYLPVYIKSDGGNYFTGTWASYAGFINRLTNAGVVPDKWEDCKVTFLSGSDFNPLQPHKISLPSSKRACAAFPEVNGIPQPEIEPDVDEGEWEIPNFEDFKNEPEPFNIPVPGEGIPAAG